MPTVSWPRATPPLRARLVGTGAVVGAIGAWQVAALGSASPLLPGPGLVSRRLWADAASGLLWEHGRVTLGRGLGGLALALVVGSFLGLGMARSRLVDAMVEPLLAATYPVPKLALYPLLLLTFGFGTWSKVGIVCLECLYPITYATYAGVRAINRDLFWTCQNLGAGRLATLRGLILPAAWPSLLTGMRVAMPTMLVVMVVTELLGESRGLGFLIRLAGSNFEAEGALAVVMLLGAIGFLLDRLLFAFARLVAPWEDR